MDDIDDVLKEVKSTLEFMAKTGCTGFECSKNTIDVLNKLDKTASLSDESLDSIRNELGECKRCKLYGGRTNIVFGTGDPNAGLVFVGEGPGYDEDKKGEPFVGRAGQLLTKIIEAINLNRDKVYICNIIKCRPPSNRNPATDEIKACFPFLKRQLDAIGPDYICALGTFAAQTLLDTNEPISRLRGRLFEYRGIKVMPTYHPAYLLRNPEKKRDVWEDMKKLMSLMKGD